MLQEILGWGSEIKRAYELFLRLFIGISSIVLAGTHQTYVSTDCKVITSQLELKKPWKIERK